MILTLDHSGKNAGSTILREKRQMHLKSLMKLAPKTATVLPGWRKRYWYPVEQVKKGDIFVVRPGESIPGGWYRDSGRKQCGKRVRPDR